MKSNSWKSALKNGAITGGISFLLFLIFTCILNYFILDGKTFFEAVATTGKEEINGISFMTVNYIYTIIAALVPVIFTRYTKIKFLAVNAGIALVVFEVLNVLLAVLLAFGIVNIFGLYGQYTFEILSYAVVTVPAGSVFGTIVTLVINSIINEREDKTAE